MNDPEFNTSVLSEMPYHIASNYQKLLQAVDDDDRVQVMLHLYGLILRTLAITLVSQYLIRDRETVQDPELNTLLIQTFPRWMEPADWQRLVFTSLQVYEGHKNLLFMPELYDLYWDASAAQHKMREPTITLFNHLTKQAYEKPLSQDTTAWQKYVMDLTAQLRQLLEELMFLQDYDLIRVVDYDQESYGFELYKGLSITEAHEPLPTLSKLSRGLFYLRSRRREFLLLHPLLIFWDQSEDAILQPDTGIYNRFTADRLQYLLSSLGNLSLESVVNDDRTRSVQAFINLVYETVENIKRYRQRTEQLTWLQLRNIGADITYHRIQAIQHKYDKTLYLQRANAHGEFLQFLESDKRCFVLIGKSGVGKSNFLVALSDELSASRSDVCFLMYDGAQVGESTSISQLVAQDFNNRLIIADKQVEDIWQEIAKIDGINDHKVVLCIDAINESARAKELLRQLDDLVLTPWPWLKIVVSCRPETWRSIRRGVSLAESSYYTETGSGAHEVSLEPFSYSERLEPFSRDELQVAYGKYQNKFQVQTDFAHVSPHVREILREPLNLWLVASRFHNQEIPLTIRVVDLVEMYVEGLIESGRLHSEDLRLLEKRLVPLMARPGRFSNVITSEDLDAGGDDLYAALYSSYVLSDGQRVNQSFTNLVDTEILIQQEGWRKQSISFKYERFYEYFVGKRLLELSLTAVDRKTFFSSMIGLTTDTPFLWGAIRSALIEDALQHTTELVRSLCFTDQQRLKEMMVDMLSLLGRDYPEKITNMLAGFIPPPKKTTVVQRLRPVGTRPIASTARNAGKIAVEVSGILGIGSILRSAALQEDPTIRTAAVRYAYRFWQREKEQGFKLLEQLAQVATSSIIPNFTAFDSMLGLSVVIFFDHLHDEVVLKRLQRIWHTIINKLLAIEESSGRISRVFRGFIRERAISVVLSIGFRLLHDLPDYNVVSYARLEAFFRLTDEQRALYLKMTQYLDPHGGYSLEDLRADLMRAFEVRKDLLITTICQFSLVVYAVGNPHESLPLLEDLLVAAERDPLPNVWVSVIPIVLEAILDHNPLDETTFDFFVRVVTRNHTYYASEFGKPGLLTSESPEAAYLGTYIYYQFLQHGTVHTEWLQSRITAALDRGDNEFFRSLLNTHLPIAGIERSNPKAALEALALFFHRGTPEIDRLNLQFLARLRVYYPDEVDSFLEDQQASEELQLQVRTNEPLETVGELIGLRAFRFLRDDVLIGSDRLRPLLIEIFAKAVECKNARQWINYLLREAVNQVYGGQALAQSR